MKIFYLSLLIFLCSNYNVFGQKTEIEFDLQKYKPSYKVSNLKPVQINIKSPAIDNLLRQYDANPFKTPVIATVTEIQQSISVAFMQYLSNVGLQVVPESNNQINLNVVLCTINYLSGKGWTATTKFDLEIFSSKHEIISQIAGGYEEEGGTENEFEYAQIAINNALYEAFESVNWEIIASELSNNPSVTTQNDNNQKTSINNNSIHISWPSIGKYYALIIAIDDYHHINKLSQPINDATRLQQVLTSSYNFKPENVFFLKNPTRSEIIDKMDDLVTIIKESDNLLMFYAGHGYWDAARETGYWLPVNAKTTSTANWLRNTTIQEYLGDIKSKHTLLIADACFGGGIFKTRKAFYDAPSAINQIYELTSRKAITSGMLNEVPDKSVFIEYLIKRLEQNDQKYTSSLQLFTSFRIAVMNNSDNVPQYGTIQKTGDEGGDFIFIKTR